MTLLVNILKVDAWLIRKISKGHFEWDQVQIVFKFWRTLQPFDLHCKYFSRNYYDFKTFQFLSRTPETLFTTDCSILLILVVLSQISHNIYNNLS